MAGNPNFTTPIPSAPDFLALYTDYQTALNACDLAKDAQKAATAMKDEKRELLMQALTKRGLNVTLLEAAAHALPALDAEMSGWLEAELARHGVQLLVKH